MELPRVGGPVSVGLCRDSAPHITQPHERGYDTSVGIGPMTMKVLLSE